MKQFYFERPYAKTLSKASKKDYAEIHRELFLQHTE